MPHSLIAWFHIKRHFVAALALTWLILAFPSARAELVQNGDFANGTTGWNTLAGAAFAVNGGVAEISNRTQLWAGPQQSLLPELMADGNGTTYTIRCRVNVTTETAVRMSLSMTDAAGDSLSILAERVIPAEDAGQWIDIKGVWPVRWAEAGALTLTKANLEFFIGHKTSNVLPAGHFPNYMIDDVSVQRDEDGDGLPDMIELGFALNSTETDDADTDGDGMPDGWERDAGLDPLIPGANTHSDSDEFTDYQEYWAATDPLDGAFHPGKPSNPAASAAAQAVLRYLALLPSSGNENRILAGQHCTFLPADYDSQIVPLAALPMGRWPAVAALQYDDGGNPPIITVTNQYALDWWRAGGLVEIKWNPRHPWTQGFYGLNLNLVRMDGLLTPDPGNQADLDAHNFFVGEIDVVGQGLADLQTQEPNMVVLWRFCSEMNGAHFWWGNHSRQQYIAMWRFIHDRLTNYWGLNNLLWVYEADAGAHAKLPADYYYPGDDYVDLIGHNFYHRTFYLEFDSEGIFRRYPKVYAFPQTGPFNVTNVTPPEPDIYRDGSWDNMNYLRGADGVSGFKRRHPRCSYFSVWSSFAAQHLGIIDNQNPAALLNDPWIVTRDDLPFESFVGPMGLGDWSKM